MRVLFVTDSGLISGAERALLDELAVLPNDVEPVVACPPGPLEGAVRALSTEVAPFRGLSGGLRLRPVHGARFGYAVAGAARDLNGVITRARPDVIHANTLRAGLAAAASRPSNAVPTVLHVHDALPASAAASMVRLALRSSAEAVIAISQYVASKFAGRSKVHNMHVLHNPLDVDVFDPRRWSRPEARDHLHLPQDVPVIAVVAQITPWKGQEVAIRALSLIRRRHPDARLILVGETKFVGRGVRYDNPAYRRRLGTLVTELGLGHNVEFWGESEEVAQIMRAVDVLLVPSWEEPFGRSAIEGMAMESAVVATSIGGPSEYIEDGVDGLLLPPKDVSRWAGALNDLLGDAATRHSLGERASPKVRTAFDRRPYTERVVQVYEEVIGRHHAPRRLSRQGPPRIRATSGRLRILFVEHGPEIGGGQHSLLELLRVLASEHELVLACPDGQLPKAAAALGVATVPIQESQLAFKLRPRTTTEQSLRMLQARLALRRHVRLVRPDIVHANSLRAGILTSGITDDVPRVAHCRDLLPPGVAARAARRAVLSGNSLTVAVSRAVARRLAGERWADRRVAVVYNPVDTTRFDPSRWVAEQARRELGLMGSPLLGMVAQITPWKGQHRALRLLHRVREHHPAAELLLVGEAKFTSTATSYDNLAYERELHRTADELGLRDAVRFLGERDDVARIMAALDVLLVPSTEEPFGRSVIEALAMGLPVVTTDQGGPGEVVRPGVDGAVLPPDDLDGWTHAVLGLIPRGRSAQSREYVLRHFSSEQHAAEVLAIYERAIGLRSRNGAGVAR